jgi:hypothetical protein
MMLKSASASALATVFALPCRFLERRASESLHWRLARWFLPPQESLKGSDKAALIDRVIAAVPQSVGLINQANSNGS